MGLGLLGGGAGAAKFFVSHGAHVVVTDTKTRDKLEGTRGELSGFDIEYVLGGHREKDFTQADLVLKNPSVPSDSPFLSLARKHGIPVHMSESLFMSLSPTKNIIGVTGTRGKSTTTALIFRVLLSAGKHVHTAGNIPGQSTLSLLDQVDSSSWVVLELSSWQLESFGWWKISPHIAVLTNIYEDHLNRYASMDEYIADKQQIFMHQKKDDVFVVNGSRQITRNIAGHAPSRTVYFDATMWPSTERLQIPGGHNIENAAACLTVCRQLGVDDRTIISAISSFSGLPGRLECIRELDGVRYINDTTSTTPVAAISGMHAFPSQSIVLIAGGSSKRLPVDALADEIMTQCKALVLIKGDGTDELVRKLVEKGYTIDPADVYETLSAAVSNARKKASPGDIILFSPGFASFSMYTNEFERGNDYVTTVTSLHAS